MDVGLETSTWILSSIRYRTIGTISFIVYCQKIEINAIDIEFNAIDLHRAPTNIMENSRHNNINWKYYSFIAFGDIILT